MENYNFFERKAGNKTVYCFQFTTDENVATGQRGLFNIYGFTFINVFVRKEGEYYVIESYEPLKK